MKHQEKPSPKQKVVLRKEEVLEYLGISPSSLSRLMAGKKIPYIKCDRIVLFRLIDLENFLKPPPRIYSDSEVIDVILNTVKRMSANG